MPKSSEARLRANKKYKELHTANISMIVKKEVKERIKAAADERGMSLQGFILQCVDQVIDSDIGS